MNAVQQPPLTPDANHVWRPGLMTMKDLHRYVAPEREPTRVGYHGLDVYGMGPPSSGGTTVGEALNILEGFDLDPDDRTQALHLFLEASRFSFADRSAYVADPDFEDVPVTGLLSDGFAATRRALIDPQHAATSPVAPGDPWPFNGGGVVACAGRGDDGRGVDHAPHRLRPGGQRRLVHVHDRVDGRQRHRRARLGVPAQQRADGLQLRLARRIRTASRAASARAAR